MSWAARPLGRRPAAWPRHRRWTGVHRPCSRYWWSCNLLRRPAAERFCCGRTLSSLPGSGPCTRWTTCSPCPRRLPVPEGMEWCCTATAPSTRYSGWAAFPRRESSPTRRKLTQPMRSPHRCRSRPAENWALKSPRRYLSEAPQVWCRTFRGRRGPRAATASSALPSSSSPCPAANAAPSRCAPDRRRSRVPMPWARLRYTFSLSVVVQTKH